MKPLFLTILLIWIFAASKAQTVMDIDSNVYKTVIIGNQMWIAENLKTTRFSDGSPIENIILDSVWATSKSAAFCYYENDSTYKNEYGNLYNFYSVIDSRNVCPKGWHVPTLDEWNTLIEFLGGDSVAGGKMKEAGQSHWVWGNVGGDNSSGLTVIPAGYRYGQNGGFNGLKGNGAIWTSTSSSDTTSIAKYFYPGSASIGHLDNINSYGRNIRCLSNTNVGLKEIIRQDDILIYPNPSKGIINVNFETVPKDFSLEVFDSNGRKVRVFKNEKSIDISELPKQSYFLKIVTIDKIKIVRIIRE